MFSIDAMSRTPVYEQIENQLEKFILSEIIREGEQIPSIREMSLELLVNPNTVTKAYSELDTKGIIKSVPGKGYFVCSDACAILKNAVRDNLEKFRCDVHDMALAGITKSELYDIIDSIFEDMKAKDKVKGDNLQ